MEDDWLEMAPPPPPPESSLPLESPSKKDSGVPVQPSKKSTATSIFDDDLPDLAPLDFPTETPVSATKSPPSKSQPAPEQPAKSKPSEGPGTSKSILDSLDDDIPLAPLPTESKKAATESKKPATKSALEDLMLESEALIKTSDLDVGDEFSFKCKVCGTLLYVRESQIGKMTRCPDCYSESLVPKPNARPKNLGSARIRETSSMSLAPVDAKSVRDPKAGRAESEVILERAREELDKQKEDLDGIQGSFDSKRWISLIFWFCQDLSLVIVTIVLSIVCALWMLAVSWIPEALELTDQMAGMVRGIVFFVPSIPLVGSCILLGLSIFMMVANQLKRLDDWPFSRIGDSLGELFMFLASVSIAAVPGGIIGLPLNSLFGGVLGTIVFSFLSIWILFPFFFLSMANNNRITEPFSRVVFDSLKGRADAWGAMYLQTMLAYGGFFVLINFAMQPGLIGEAILGLMLPLFVFFVMNQYGLLAGRLSDITELGFEGDFSQDTSEE
ncbi:hypothetical protein SH449x_002036 [Pirellulaceae bacterium SH449]